MYAVIRTGGKQYRVSPNDVIRVEKLPAAAGTVIDFADILSFGDAKGATIGTPLVQGALVKAEVVEQIKDDKVIIFKRHRRKHFRRTNGHRQRLTVLRITEIAGPDGQTMTAAEAKAAAKPKVKKAKKAKTADKKKKKESAEEKE
ncbi:MAG: 50S ribosomal protein L21 [Alphaproteobacteria bacterium]|nr:50S ribosomal protein L21 [Alphaproteobacteria bacterium]